MSEALGDQVFIEPIELNGDTWTGKVVDRGFKVIKYTTIYECNLVTYNVNDIVKSTKYGGVTVHIVMYQNTIKIEGVY